MENNNGYNFGDVLVSFLLGGIIGAGVALMMARESGEVLRDRIRKYADETWGSAEDYVQHARGKIDDTIERGKSMYEGRRRAITNAIDAGKEAYEEEQERYKEKHAKGSEA